MATKQVLYTTDGTPLTATAVTTGTAKTIPVGNRLFVQLLLLDDAATDGTDTLDVAIQSTIDGTNWFDVVAFTQVDGTASSGDIQAAMITTEATSDPFATVGVLAAGTTRDFFGQTYRTSVDITSGNSASFDIEVTILGL